MDLAFRQGTWDRDIWRSVAEHNEYGLLAHFEANDVIVDVGAHIGAFTYLALDRGAGHVVAIEPDPDNFLYLRHNIHAACRATDRAILIAAAAWPTSCVLQYTAVGVNTGGGNTLGSTGMPVAAIAFEKIMELAASLSTGARIRLVKLDCEGAEWPILFGANGIDLTHVDAWIGEYHSLRSDCLSTDGRGQFNQQRLGEFFQHRDFQTTFSGPAEGIGFFKAWRPGKVV